MHSRSLPLHSTQACCITVKVITLRLPCRAVSSRRLVPGDVVALLPGKATCDMVLLRGSCLVEESLLSGEVCFPPSSMRMEPQKSRRLANMTLRQQPTAHLASYIMVLWPTSQETDASVPMSQGHLLLGHALRQALQGLARGLDCKAAVHRCSEKHYGT